MIDLHTHTTASDGRTSPEALVREAVGVGIRTLAVTDHDTVSAFVEAETAARAVGVRLIPGIEITAVHQGRDVHVLGYFIDVTSRELSRFLEMQRADRRRRLSEILARLAELGVSIDEAPLLARSADDGGKAIGRPMVAEALVAAGHAKDISDAFERFLSAGRPAFIERRGATPEEVVGIIGRAGGLSSLAHPGKSGVDAIVSELAAAGLSALEVYHPDHDERTMDRYREMAARYGLLVTGGSDFHGAGSGRAAAFGRTTLPEHEFARIERRLASR